MLLGQCLQSTVCLLTRFTFVGCVRDCLVVTTYPRTTDQRSVCGYLLRLLSVHRGSEFFILYESFYPIIFNLLPLISLFNETTKCIIFERRLMAHRRLQRWGIERWSKKSNSSLPCWNSKVRPLDPRWSFGPLSHLKARGWLQFCCRHYWNLYWVSWTGESTTSICTLCRQT